MLEVTSFQLAPPSVLENSSGELLSLEPTNQPFKPSGAKNTDRNLESSRSVGSLALLQLESLPFSASLLKYTNADSGALSTPP